MRSLRTRRQQKYQQAVPISSSVSCMRETTNRIRPMRAPRGRRVEIIAIVHEDLSSASGPHRRRHDEDAVTLHASDRWWRSSSSSSAAPPNESAPPGPPHIYQRHHRHHSNGALLLLYLVLITLNQSMISVYCKPNTSNQHHHQQQLQLTDKQLLRKALDSSESSRALAIGSAISQSSSSSGAAGGSDSASSTTSTTTAASIRAAPVGASANSEQNNGQPVGNQFQCPEQFGYYTDTKDCTKYYVCVFGEVLHESCTGGLRFSRELQTCDWPRNVDCPNQQANNNQTTTNSEIATTTAATTSSSSSSTTTASTTATQGSGFSSSAPPKTTLPATSGSTTSTATVAAAVATTTSSTSSVTSPTLNGIQDNRSKSGASLVFADENSDPQQPSFDEAISPVITADGAIHLHDGSGGTFALGPNPNRALASSAPQSINGPIEAGSLSTGGGEQSSQADRNVDVFVMPLSLGFSSSQSRNHQQANNKRQRARFQQQVGAQGQQPKLMLVDKQQQQSFHLQASLPPTTSQQRQQQQQQHNSRQASNEANSRNAAELNDESADFNLNGPTSLAPSAGNDRPELDAEANNNENSNGNRSELDEDQGDQIDGPSAGQSSPVPNGQADREVDERSLQGAGNAGNEISGSADQDQFAGNNQNSDYSEEMSAGQQQPASNSYIPPVLASAASSSNNENFNSRQFQPGPPSSLSPLGDNDNRQRQQSSPLLSVNNRQIVDPTRQTFKPIVAPNGHAGQQHQNGQLPSSNNRLQPQQQRQQQQQQQFQNSNQNTNQNQRSTIQQQQQQQQSNINANNRQNNQQQLQQLQNNNAQNNRQSRMSSQFGGGGGNPSSLASPNPLLAAPNQSSPLSSASRFLPTADKHQQQLFSNNNVNFNDSSKLIRLPTSQQAQLFDGDNSKRHNQLTPTFQPRFPQQQQARSQSTLLFSAQKPGFGFMSTPPNPFSSSSDDSLANHTTASVGLFHEQSSGGNNARQPTNEFHQTFSGPQQQQQQQRRSRPPKRHQIPSGSSSSSAAANRQRQTSSPLDFATTTTTSLPTAQMSRDRTTMATINSNNDDDSRRHQRPTPASNAFEPADFEQAGPPTRLQLRPASAVAPPTTVNFRDSSPAAFQTTTTRPPPPAGTRQRLANSGGQSPPRASSVGPGLQTSQLVPTTAVDQLVNSRVPTSGGDFNQSPAPTAISSNGGQSSSLAIGDSLTTTVPTSSSMTAAVASSSDNLIGATQPTSDPQAVANRYLSSAIDALEAGQPFGTVDYDFDILNDNSTERRAPTTPAGDQNHTQLLRPATSSASGRSRQEPNGGSQQDQGNDSHAPPPPSNGPRPRGSSASGRQSSTSGTPQQQQPLATTMLAVQPAGAPTKKPRPTNKKIVVNHEQALANIRASAEPAKRPEALFSTPQPLQQATKCDNRICRLPDCKCGDTLAPGGMDPKVIPQVVLLTFDDAVNDLNWEIYEELFTGRTNPNGCPVLATFYVSHEWTDYGQVQTLYSRGHEMASHSVTHSFGEKFSKSQWFKEINGQREILNMYGGVKMNDVRGMRAPFLQIGGNKMFEMLYDANFTYDSSMPIFENSPPLWPYTLDYQLSHECMITPCPTKSFPGVWEVGMTMWVDLRGGRCSMGDACTNPTDEDGVYEMLMKNFNRHYKSNRAPFGLFYHSAWFNTVHHRRGFLRFMSTVNALPDVFFVTNWQMLQWMRQPTPISEINSFEPWQCPAKNDRPPPCYHPSVCNVKSEHGTRFMKTCQPCPANQQYPWKPTGLRQFKDLVSWWQSGDREPPTTSRHNDRAKSC